LKQVQAERNKIIGSNPIFVTVAWLSNANRVPHSDWV